MLNTIHGDDNPSYDWKGATKRSSTQNNNYT